MTTMTARRNLISLFGIFRAKKMPKTSNVVLNDGTDSIADPHADEHFTVLDGKPVTFREFNQIMEQHFAAQIADPRQASANLANHRTE